MSKSPIELDRIDRQLLNLLQKDNRLSADVLAEKVGSSRSSVQRRLQRLRREGAFAADISVLSSRVTGDKVLAIVEVKLESVRSDLLDKFRQKMLALDEVQQCYYTAGKVDFVIILALDTLADYDALARRCFADDPNVYRYHSNIVADRVKVGLSVPLKA